MLGCNTAFLTIISPGQCVSPSLPPLSQPLLSSLQSFLSPLDIPEFGTLINFRSKSINLIYLPIYTLSALPFHHHHHHHHHQSPKSIIFSFLQILNTRQLKQQIWSYTPSHPLFSVILFWHPSLRQWLEKVLTKRWNGLLRFSYCCSWLTMPWRNRPLFYMLL